MSVLYQGIAFVRHWLRAGTAHGLHSPFVFGLYVAMERAAKLSTKPFWQPVDTQKQLFTDWAKIEAERSRLLTSNKQIQITDFGAGSLVSSSKKRALGSLAASGLLPKKWCRRLAVLQQHLPQGPVLELGTSLGITTAYLAQNQPHSSVYTLDGCAGSLAEAQGVWHNLGLADRIYPTLGNIDDTLPAVLAKGPFSLIILDANHKSGPVRQYFEAVLPYVHPEGCIVLDDIYWTPDMTAAWHAISGDPRVLQSVDLYRQGWLFFRQSQVREQFRLRALG